MKEFSEGVVPSNGVNLHYYRSAPPARRATFPLHFGSEPARPVIVLLHGVTDSGKCWVRVAEDLRQNYEVVAVDARGHGLSEAPETGYGADDRAADIAGLIEALKLDRPVLFGHSMGAETAIAVAGLYPDLVRGVILEDPPWPGRFWGSTPEERAERAERMAAEIEENRSKTKEQLIEQARAEHPNWPEDELEPWAESKLQVSPNIASRVVAPRRRWSDYVRETVCPVLLITADTDRGALVSDQTAKEAALYWKSGRVAHIPGAGHCIHREQFEPVMQAVYAFLKKL